jgi:BirA family biotin operon repressor/biotin-[acetyl-CoA-carboxylase] ligase
MMFDEDQLRQRLPVSGLGELLSFHQEVTSTNALAHDLAEQGAPHGTLVVAEAQTQGRGRRDRIWITKPGRGLAISIILRPEQKIPNLWSRLHALSALSLAQALEGYQLQPKIKWPNDVLLNGKKVAGILVELSWDGDHLDYFILGIGMNVTVDSVPQEFQLQFPAVSMEEVLGKEVDPYRLLVQLLEGIDTQFSTLTREDLFERWEKKLAYVGQEVLLTGPEKEYSGTFMGISREGMLELQTQDKLLEIEIGDYQMRLRNGQNLICG